MRFTLSEIEQLYKGLYVEVPNALASPAGIEENGNPLSWEDLTERFPDKQYLLLDVSKSFDGDGTAELLRLKRMQLKYAEAYFGDTALSMKELCTDDGGVNLISDKQMSYEDIFRNYSAQFKILAVMSKSPKNVVIDAIYENRNDIVLSWDLLTERYLSSAKLDANIQRVLKSYVYETEFQEDLNPQAFEVRSGKLVPMESVPTFEKAVLLTDIEMNKDFQIISAVPRVTKYSWNSILSTYSNKRVILCNKTLSKSGKATVEVIPIRRLDWESITKFYPDRWVVLGNTQEDDKGNTLVGDVLAEASDASIDRVSEDVYATLHCNHLSVERTSWPSNIPLE